MYLLNETCPVGLAAIASATFAGIGAHRAGIFAAIWGFRVYINTKLTIQRGGAIDIPTIELANPFWLGASWAAPDCCCALKP